MKLLKKLFAIFLILAFIFWTFGITFYLFFTVGFLKALGYFVFISIFNYTTTFIIGLFTKKDAKK